MHLQKVEKHIDEIAEANKKNWIIRGSAENLLARLSFYNLTK